MFTVSCSTPVPEVVQPTLTPIFIEVTASPQQVATIAARDKSDEATAVVRNATATVRARNQTLRPTVTRQPVSLSVYDRIEGLTDCKKLQKEFDTAMDNHDRAPSGSALRKLSLSYAKLADQRMGIVGCYR